MIYLDNAATTFKKPLGVLKAVENAIINYSANPGRGGHQASLKAAEKMYEVRRKTAEFFGAEDTSSVCFMANCTTAVNIVLNGVLKKGDHVLVSSLEHNAVMRPLHAAAFQYGIEFDIIKIDITSPKKALQDIEKEVKNNTKLMFFTHASNVTGTLLPIKEIGAFCREKGILFAVDAAQSAGHVNIDMQDMNIDYLCIAPHKGLYAPMGTGILIAEQDIERVLVRGGTGVNSISMQQPENLPERIESGTVNLPGILGIGAGIDFIKNRKIASKIKQEEKLIRFAAKKLGAVGAKVYGNYDKDSSFVPVLSFNIGGASSEKVASFLSTNKIAVRGGLQCAPFAHETIGTKEQGTVRISTSVFNTPEDIEKLVFFVKKYKSFY